MPTTISVSLPVEDLAAAENFYCALGCRKDTAFSSEQSSMMVWSETIALQLLSHDYFGVFVPKKIADSTSACEVLIALSRDNREDVDRAVEAGAGAGGRADIREALDMGFMYNRCVEDPDGHVIEFVWMDMRAVADTPNHQPTRP